MATRARKQAASKVKRAKAGRAKSKAPKVPAPAVLATVTIRSSEFIPAAPSAVYRAFVDARTFSAVTGANATFERREGGRFRAADGFITGRFVRLQNDRRIVQEWKTTEWPVDAPPSLLELRFVPRENGTEVRMVQSQVPAGHALRYKRGWSALCWTPMKKYFHESR
jgi:activator of HSP90 ATPase